MRSHSKIWGSLASRIQGLCKNGTHLSTTWRMDAPIVVFIFAAQTYVWDSSLVRIILKSPLDFARKIGSYTLRLYSRPFSLNKFSYSSYLRHTLIWSILVFTNHQSNCKTFFYKIVYWTMKKYCKLANIKVHQQFLCAIHHCRHFCKRFSNEPLIPSSAAVICPGAIFSMLLNLNNFHCSPYLEHALIWFILFFVLQTTEKFQSNYKTFSFTKLHTELEKILANTKFPQQVLYGNNYCRHAHAFA